MENAKRYDFSGGGIGRNSVLSGDANLPLKLLWKAEGLCKHEADILLSNTAVVVFSRTRAKVPLTETKVSVFSRTDGKLLWEYFPEGEIRGVLCLYEDLVLISESSRSLLALKDGEVAWRHETNIGTSSTCHFDGEIITGSNEGVYFLSPETGETLRHYETGRTGMLSFNEDVVLTSEASTGVLYCFGRKSGELLWNTDFGELGKYDGFGGMNKGTLGSRTPLIIDGRLYAAGDGRVVCFDINNGKLLWMTPAEALRETLYRDGYLFCNKSRNFYRIDARTGEIIQRNQFIAEFGHNNLGYIAGKYLFCAGRGLVAIDIETGEMAWSYFDKRKTVHFTGQPIFLDGRLYTADTNGSVYCFGQES